MDKREHEFTIYRNLPSRIIFNGKQIINHSLIRSQALEKIASGTIDEKINRRGQMVMYQEVFYKPSRRVSSVARHTRNTLRKNKHTRS